MAELAGFEAAREVFGAEVGVAERYVDILATRGVEWGLIGPRETQRLWDRHVLNSMAVSDSIPPDSFVVDVGSGAGLPGIPLAIGRPDLKITLLESMERRTRFLEEVVSDLGLADRVRVIRGRAEEHREAYDIVTSRAVARMPQLLQWCAPLLARGGRIVALKGQSAKEEVSEARPVARRHGLRCRAFTVRVHDGAEETWVVVCE